jgi:hypothetical protein
MQAKVERAETALKNIELENAALLRRIQTNTQPKGNFHLLGKYIFILTPAGKVTNKFVA